MVIVLVVKGRERGRVSECGGGEGESESERQWEGADGADI